VIVAFDLFIFPKDCETLKSLARHVYETDWMPIEDADPDQAQGVFSDARYALFIGDGWVAHVDMYRAEEVEKWVELAEWHRDRPEVFEGFVDCYPLEITNIDSPHIYCNKEEDKCKAEAKIEGVRIKSYARIYIDFGKNVPREVIEIAMRGSSGLPQTQIVI
jgi:hypothetical protein